MIPISNCKLQFKCPKDWHALERTSVDDVRFCKACNKSVYAITTEAEFDEAVELGRCVAMIGSDRRSRPLMGAPMRR